MTTPMLTKNQSLVFDVLTKAEAPLSAYTILDKLTYEVRLLEERLVD